MSFRPVPRWMAMVACTAAGFAAGAWWGGRSFDRDPAVVEGAITLPAPPSSEPAVAASGSSEAAEDSTANLAEAAPAVTTGTIVPPDAVEQDPQVAVQAAAAASYAGTEVVPATPASTGAAEQASMQSFEPLPPVPPGPDRWPAPSGAGAQLAIQAEAAQ